MKLDEYDPQQGEPYHFESSQSYCDPARVAQAANSVQEELGLDVDDRAQLDAIVALEALRYQLAEGNLELPEYQRKVQEAVRACDARCGRSPFDPTRVHDEFYERLNSEYDES